MRVKRANKEQCVATDFEPEETWLCDGDGDDAEPLEQPQRRKAWLCDGDGDDAEPLEQPQRRKARRSYSAVRLREQEAWEKLRVPLVRRFRASQTMPPAQLCMSCPSPAEFRCRDCSAVAYYCEQCCRSQHRWCNIYHVPERWDSECARYRLSPLFGLVIPLTHECTTAYRESITVVSLKGKKKR